MCARVSAGDSLYRMELRSDARMVACDSHGRVEQESQDDFAGTPPVLASLLNPPSFRIRLG